MAPAFLSKNWARSSRKLGRRAGRSSAHRRRRLVAGQHRRDAAIFTVGALGEFLQQMSRTGTVAGGCRPQLLAASTRFANAARAQGNPMIRGTGPIVASLHPVDAG